jgi:hypothetical protein
MRDLEQCSRDGSALGNEDKLLQCLKELGIDDLKQSLSDFSERKRIQKAVCLLQYIFGIDLGYNFSWYIHGPYSPDLTKTLFELAESEPRKVGSPPPRDKDRIEAFKKFVGDSFGSAEQMELTGSLFFLYYLGKKRATASDDEILETFREKKPFFSDADVEKVWSKRTQVERLLS